MLKFPARHNPSSTVVIYMNMDAGEDIHLELPHISSERNIEADAALESLFRAQYSRLSNLLMRITSDRGRAEELASEVFCKLARRPILFRPGNNLEAWLYRTAMNLGLDSLKMEMRRRKHEDAAAGEAARNSAHSDSPLQNLIRAEERRRVRAVIAELKPLSARALLLRHAGFSYGELARVLKINPASVGQLLLRSHAEFARKYHQQCEAQR
jgi:RNA polymerase sigma-70 factor, ECF subfamily